MVVVRQNGTMRAGDGKREAFAATALAKVVHDAVIVIRGMAWTQEGLADDSFPDTNYHEQIRALADLCDTLVPGLQPGLGYSATQALQYTWDSRSAAQRQWLQSHLQSHGVDINDLIVTSGSR